jgi:hypothetical protein
MVLVTGTHSPVSIASLAEIKRGIYLYKVVAWSRKNQLCPHNLKTTGPIAEIQIVLEPARREECPIIFEKPFF